MEFTARPIENIDNGKGYWSYQKIGIYQDDKPIGEYTRNYSCLYDTFVPFKQGEKWYALYSKDYTATRVMSLPDCKDLGGEKSNAYGFCPVEFYVPWDDEDLLCHDAKVCGQFGFVAGCHWGDDSSWKIQYLDLSKVAEGKLVRDDRFGYVEMMPQLTLKQSIDFTPYCYDPDDAEENKHGTPESRQLTRKRVYIACRHNYPLLTKSKDVDTYFQPEQDESPAPVV